MVPECWAYLNTKEKIEKTENGKNDNVKVNVRNETTHCDLPFNWRPDATAPLPPAPALIIAFLFVVNVTVVNNNNNNNNNTNHRVQ